MLNHSNSHCHDLPFPVQNDDDRERRLSCYASRLEHDIFFLYVFLASEDLSSEACEFLKSHADDPIPVSFLQF